MVKIIGCLDNEMLAVKDNEISYNYDKYIIINSLQKYTKWINIEVKKVWKYHCCIYFCTNNKKMSSFYD